MIWFTLSTSNVVLKLFENANGSFIYNLSNEGDPIKVDSDALYRHINRGDIVSILGFTVKDGIKYSIYKHIDSGLHNFIEYNTFIKIYKKING